MNVEVTGMIPAPEVAVHYQKWAMLSVYLLLVYIYIVIREYI